MMEAYLAALKARAEASALRDLDNATAETVAHAKAAEGALEYVGGLWLKVLDDAA